MGQLRAEKVQEFIKQEASKIILNDLKDPRIGFVTVTDVIVTNDLRKAKIYVSLFGSDEAKAETFKGLNSSLGFLRSEIGKRVNLRFVPEMSLHIDESLDKSDHIQKILLKINQEERE